MNQSWNNFCCSYWGCGLAEYLSVPWKETGRLMWDSLLFVNQFCGMTATIKCCCIFTLSSLKILWHQLCTLCQSAWILEVHYCWVIVYVIIVRAGQESCTSLEIVRFENWLPIQDSYFPLLTQLSISLLKKMNLLGRLWLTCCDFRKLLWVFYEPFYDSVIQLDRGWLMKLPSKPQFCTP